MFGQKWIGTTICFKVSEIYSLKNSKKTFLLQQQGRWRGTDLYSTSLKNVVLHYSNFWDFFLFRQAFPAKIEFLKIYFLKMP